MSFQKLATAGFELEILFDFTQNILMYFQGIATSR